MKIISITGKHSPFDSDACFIWGLYCDHHKRDPDKPLNKKEQKDADKWFKKMTSQKRGGSSLK